MKLSDCENILLERKIEYLYHFTCVDSLKGILQHGLQPKKWLNENNVEVNFLRQNSTHYEGNEDATSYSIEFPNYKMFYKLRCDYKNIKFVVIVININELEDLEFNCYSMNASCGYGSSLCDDFEDLFYQEDRAIDLPTNYPTNPQAEIQVFGGIKEIYRIFTLDDQTLQDLKKDFPDNKDLFEMNADIFLPRIDHNDW